MIQRIAVLAAVATATPALALSANVLPDEARSVEDRALTALQTHYMDPALSEAENAAAHAAWVACLPSEDLVELAEAQKPEDIMLLVAFAPVATVICQIQESRTQ